MPDKAAVLAELTADELQTVPAFAALRETIVAGVTQEQESRVAELTQQIAGKDARIAELEADNTVKTQLVAEFQRGKFDADLKAHIAELTAWNTNGKPEATEKLNALRAAIYTLAQSKLGGVVMEMEQAKPQLEELMTGDLKVLVEMTRDNLAGPAIRIGGVGREGVQKPVEPTEEDSKKAVQSFGLTA
jgi:cell division protein FtsB